MLTAPDEIQDLAFAFQKSRALLTAVELGLFTALGEAAKTAPELALLTATRPRTIDRLGNALVALGLLVKHPDGAFENTPLGKERLVKGKPGYLANLHHAANMWVSWGHLTLSVTRGGSAHVEPFDERGDRWLENFIAAMDTRARATAPALVDALAPPVPLRVLDVGGGSGAYALEFARRAPEARAVVLDVPNVAKIARGYLDRDPAGARVATVGGDFLKDDLGDGFDLVLVSHILHMLSPRDARRLVGRCAEALEPGGRLVIQEFIADESRTAPLEATLFALNMIVATEAGDVYTEGEMAEWMREVGFTGIGRVGLPGRGDLLVGVASGIRRGRREPEPGEANPRIAR